MLFQLCYSKRQKAQLRTPLKFTSHSVTNTSLSSKSRCRSPYAQYLVQFLHEAAQILVWLILKNRARISGMRWWCWAKCSVAHDLRLSILFYGAAIVVQFSPDLKLHLELPGNLG